MTERLQQIEDAIKSKGQPEIVRERTAYELQRMKDERKERALNFGEENALLIRNEIFNPFDELLSDVSKKMDHWGTYNLTGADIYNKRDFAYYYNANPQVEDKVGLPYIYYGQILRYTTTKENRKNNARMAHSLKTAMYGVLVTAENIEEDTEPDYSLWYGDLGHFSSKIRRSHFDNNNVYVSGTYDLMEYKIDRVFANEASGIESNGKPKIVNNAFFQLTGENTELALDNISRDLVAFANRYYIPSGLQTKL